MKAVRNYARSPFFFFYDILSSPIVFEQNGHLCLDLNKNHVQLFNFQSHLCFAPVNFYPKKLCLVDNNRILSFC